MGNEVTKSIDVSEVYTANEKLSLNSKFDDFIKSKWLSEKSIQAVKEDIARLFNASGRLTPAFLKTVNKKIENIIDNELRANLAKNSPAMQGVLVATETVQAQTKIPANTPGVTNTPSRESGQTVTWLFNAIWVVKGAVANKEAQLKAI